LAESCSKTVGDTPSLLMHGEQQGTLA
jgi:hypothetical protein